MLWLLFDYLLVFGWICCVCCLCVDLLLVRTCMCGSLVCLRLISAIGKHFRLGSQEDAHEFLRYFVDSMQKSCLEGLPPKYVCACAHVCVYTYVRMCICMCVCIRTYVRTYVHMYVRRCVTNQVNCCLMW